MKYVMLAMFVLLFAGCQYSSVTHVKDEVVENLGNEYGWIRRETTVISKKIEYIKVHMSESEKIPKLKRIFKSKKITNVVKDKKVENKELINE